MTKICCITGHRVILPDKLDYVKGELRKEISSAINDGYTNFISGFADGADLFFAEIVAELKSTNIDLKLEVAIPYRRRMKNSNRLFQELLKQCDKTVVHSEVYSPDCFKIRNQYMVSVSQRVIAVYDGRERSGTGATIRCALSLDREMRIITI